MRLKRSGSVEMNKDSLGCYDKPESKLETGRRLNKRLTVLLAESSSQSMNTSYIIICILTFFYNEYGELPSHKKSFNCFFCFTLAARE